MNQIAPISIPSNSTEAQLAALSFAELLTVVEQSRDALPTDSIVRLYQLWIRFQNTDDPRTCPAWFNLGVLFSGQRQSNHAMACYEAALRLRPDFQPAAVNLGLALESSGRPDDARRVWQKCLQPIESQTGLLNHCGRLAETQGKLAEAERDLRRSLLLDPDQPDVIQHWVHLRQRLCLWPALEGSLPGLPPETLLRNAGPLAAMALTDDVATQRAVAEHWIARKTTPGAVRLSPAEGYDHRRVRIGYLSSDFCRHAMSFLIAELFERHDRNRFEVYGYCSSPEDGSALRRRILAAFDKVVPIRDRPDDAAARLIRDDEIDVLIDLNGLTSGTRIHLLRHRPAPVQATYLGFVGPAALPELDYLLCDDTVIPPEYAARYAPTPLPVGRFFQANDSRREVGAPMPRAAAGLPEDRFLFCCFSNFYKITPEMFAAWMRILRAVPQASLWIADDGMGAPPTLRAAAEAAGVDASRLIFTGRVDPAAYLARLSLADMFLDTFPYNAGTVASDAMRMRVPLLTRMGQSFASRMAGRLLLSVGAAEGIAVSADDYAEKAIRFATDPVAYALYAAKFTDAAWQSGPGDIAAFTRGFEDAIAAVVKRPVSA
jgi:predicted O-linked N-acetylglucosamine transferase (SPINDLY family)